MGKGTRRHRKLRRRLRLTLKSGHEARHKLISGRTGHVHSKKLRSPKHEKPTGVVELLVPGGFPSEAQVVVEPQIAQPEPKKAPKTRRKPAAAVEIVEKVTPIVILDPARYATSVDPLDEAYGLCLRAIHYLSDLSAAPDSRAGRLLTDLWAAIDRFERKK